MFGSGPRSTLPLLVSQGHGPPVTSQLKAASYISQTTCSTPPAWQSRATALMDAESCNSGASCQLIAKLADAVLKDPSGELSWCSSPQPDGSSISKRKINDTQNPRNLLPINNPMHCHSAPPVSIHGTAIIFTKDKNSKNRCNCRISPNSQQRSNVPINLIVSFLACYSFHWRFRGHVNTQKN